MRSWDWRERMDGLRKQTDVHVDEAWQARIVAGVRGPRRRRFFRPALAISFAGATLAVLVWTMVAQAPTEVVHFDAKASGTRMNPDTEAVVAEQSAGRTRVDLRRGSMHFEIGRTGREFQVQAAGVTVTVLGTSFTVTRQPTEVVVAVQRGRVRVQHGNYRFELGDGDQRSIHIASVATPVVATSGESPMPQEAAPILPNAPASKSTTVPTVSPTSAGKRSARAVGAAAGPAEEDPVELLMRAADEARQAQAWAAALDDYGRVVAEHGHDARAGLASFSMGRILLHQLHRPGQAARAFAEARRLPLSPGLAREALAREIEAWHAANDDMRARGLAQEYSRRYSETDAPSVVRELTHTP